MNSRRKTGLRALGAVVATATTLAVVVAAFGGTASAATLFSDNFESGLASTWSKSGGTWGTVTDGTTVLQQSKTSESLAREFNGSTSWTDYSLSAQVKPLSFTASGDYTGIAARASSSTTFYRLALINGTGAQLQAVNSGAITVLGSSSISISTGTWYTLQIDVSGTTITGYVNGSKVASGTSSLISAGRIGLQTYGTTANFDTVAVSSGSSTTTTAAPTTTPAATTAPATTTPAATTPAATTPATTTTPTSGALYVSASGSDSAAGTLAAPTTLTSAITKIAAGGTIYLRGGTYNLSTTVTIAVGNNGTSGALKTLSAYPGETPVLNFSAMAEADANRGLAVDGNYWHVYGITVEYAGDNGIFVAGSNNTIERVVTAFNHDTGLQLSRVSSSSAQSDWPANNLILSSESHDNADSGGENADGFAAKLTVGTGNVFRYDVSHNNIDDGWDLYTKTDTGAIGPVTIDHCLSYNNGTLTNGTVDTAGDRNGFKLGGSDIAVNHIVTHSIAYNNGHHGFTYNDNTGTITVSNDVSIDSAEVNFYFPAGTSVFTNDTSCRSSSGSNDKIVGTTDSTDQFWSGTNGSRCSSYSGALGWSFASSGSLTVTFGGTVVTP